MSERERWIVYPLLFFALGAAIRDKLIHKVATGKIHAEEIRCEKLSVIDPENPQRNLAQLIPRSVTRSIDGKIQRSRVGALILTDNDGEEHFGVANDQMFIRHVQCQGVTVVDPANPRRTLASLVPVTETTKGPRPKVYSYGALLLLDSKDNERFGVANDLVRMRQIQCEGIQIIDPENPGRILEQYPPLPPESPAAANDGAAQSAK